MSGVLARRLGRLETVLRRHACPECRHVRIHLTYVAGDGTETAIGPEPDLCPTCGGELDVLRIGIEAVPDRPRTA
jgi:hypothetical protein